MTIDTSGIKDETMTEPKFPHIEVALNGEDGNAFFIMGRVAKAMKRAGCSQVDIDVYTNAAMSGDYDNLLRVTMQTVNWI